MNTNGHQPQQPLGQGPLELLISALAGTATNGQNQFMQNLGQGMSNNLHQNSTAEANTTALSLDQMFGHSGFSRAATAATSTPASQLTTPFYDILMQNSNNAQSQYSQGLMPSTPIQQTRSGRISRPPMPMPQNELMRVLAALNQPGMEAVRAALESTGMFEGTAQQQQQQDTQGQRERAVGQALQALLASQQGQGQGQGQGGQNQRSYGSTSGDIGDKGKKRARDKEPERPLPLNRYDRNDQYSASPQAAASPAQPIPKPTSGPGSRLALTKEEKQERRRERNKQSAMASRQKKQTALEEATEALARKELEVVELTEKCERLEREVEEMRRVIRTSGLHMPSRQSYSARQSYSPEPTPPPIGLEDSKMTPNLAPSQFDNGPRPYHPQPSIPTAPAPAPMPYPFPTNFNYSLFPDTPNMGTFNNDLGNMDHGNHVPEAEFDFNMFMNMDSMEDEEADGDFEPETSPHRGSDTDGEREPEVEGAEGDEEDDETTPIAKRQKRGRSRSRTRSGPPEDDQGFDQHDDYDQNGGVENDGGYDQETPADSTRGAGGDEEDFIDPEMEDEDLFLPIEDVPVPPSSASEGSRSGSGTGGKDVTGDMMKALKVDTRDQLAAVMQKLVDSAGEGGLAGVDPDVVDKLKNVIMMAQRAVGARAVAEAGGARGEKMGSEERDGREAGSDGGGGHGSGRIQG